LYLQPGSDDIIDTLDVLELLLYSFSELFDVLGREITSKSHGISVNLVTDFRNITEDGNWRVKRMINELEAEFIPNFLDGVDLLFNLVLTLSGVDKLGNLFGILEEFEFDEIIQTEGLLLERNLLASNGHKSIPMSFLHVGGMEILNERHDVSHVSNSLVKGSESFPGLDVLVLRSIRCAKLG
jgi:hypothetical protein